MKRFEGFLPETIDFLWELRMNNSKEWMDQNRDRYKAVLKDPFDKFAADLAELSPLFCGKKMNCSVSRINRDIRYSKDKSPYRSCRWAVLYDEKLRGTEWKLRPTFYFELQPEGFIHGLGMWCAKPAFLTAYRKKIDSNPAAFLRIAKKVEKDPLFRLEGEDYKKIKNETLDPLVQSWYQKKDIVICTRSGMEDILFTPELPQYLAEEWSRLKGLYAFLEEIEAE
ncbi:DUF2461 domain-containing protein [Anaerotignum sp.]